MAEKLDMEEIVERLSEYEGWEQQGERLIKRFEFEDFEAALNFVNRVGQVAENLDHHPDISLQNYNEVVLVITTHDAGGITGRDFEFLEEVEKRSA